MTNQQRKVLFSVGSRKPHGLVGGASRHLRRIMREKQGQTGDEGRSESGIQNVRSGKWVACCASVSRGCWLWRRLQTPGRNGKPITNVRMVRTLSGNSSSIRPPCAAENRKEISKSLTSGFNLSSVATSRPRPYCSYLPKHQTPRGAQQMERTSESTSYGAENPTHSTAATRARNPYPAKGTKLTRKCT